jgi:hypothetical protein
VFTVTFPLPVTVPLALTVPFAFVELPLELCRVYVYCKVLESQRSIRQLSPAPAVRVFEFGEEELFPTPVELFVV